MLHKLTKAFVEKIPYKKSGQVFYRVLVLTGFALRVGKTAKVYITDSKLNGKTIRVSIAKNNIITLDEARNHARSILAEVSFGINPHDEEKARKVKLVTVSEVLENYIEALGNLG